MPVRRACAFVAAVVAALCVAVGAGAQPGFGGSRGGFGGVEGGGARPTGGSSMGYNRAGTASSGGFAYGDAPRRQPTVTVVTGTSGSWNSTPVSVDNVLYYQCADGWYSPGLTSTGISYTKVAPPPGY